MRTWSKTSIPNVLRHKSGKYYIKMRVGGGKSVFRSLETDSAAVATLRAPVKMLEIRGEKRLALVAKTLGDCALTYLGRKKSEGLKKRALDYRTETVEMLRRTWGDFDSTDAGGVTLERCKAWADVARVKYSASRFNGMVESLRGILEIAVESKACEKNHALKVDRSEVKRNSRALPTNDRFALLLRRLKSMPSRRNAFYFIRVLAYSGQRPASVRTLSVESVDLKNNLIKWPPIKHNEQFNVQPMGRQLRLVMKALIHEYQPVTEAQIRSQFVEHPEKYFNGLKEVPWNWNANVCKKWKRENQGRKIISKAKMMDKIEQGKRPRRFVSIDDPNKALAGACRDAKIDPPLTASDFRHFFTTRALEAGIPVPIVAAMRGDKDGGAMLLRNYVHPRLEHLREMAAKL